MIILYCDGALFQGYNKNPVEHKGKKLYFRGSRIVRAHFKWIDDNYGFDKADKVVLVGGSSGGMGVYLWIDYLRGLMNNPKKLSGIVDSGIFLDPLSLGKIALSSAQLLPMFAPGALLAGSQPGGSIPVNPSQDQATLGGTAQQENINSGIPTGTGSAPTLPTDSIKQFMTLSNPD